MRTAALPVFTRRPAASRSAFWPLSRPAALALALAALLGAVSPLGEFPINDDWLYSLTVQSLVDQGRLQIPAWTAPSLVLQAYWGALFAQLFGFSFTVLRSSTLVLGAAGLIGFYLLLRELLDPGRALLGTLLLLFNPLFVTLSYSFMSDVPFLSLTLWSLFCYMRARRGPHPHAAWLAAGSTLAGGAYLVRQVGVALPLAALGGLLLCCGWRSALRPAHLAAALGPFAPALLLLRYFQAESGPIGNEAVGWTAAFWSKHGLGMVGVALARLAESYATLGLFTLPLAVGLLLAPSGLGLGGRQRWLAGALLLMLAVGLIAHVAIFDRGWLLPYVKDVLSPRGFLGRDHLNGTLPESIVIPDAALGVATIAAILGGGLLMLATATALSPETLRGPAAVMLLFGLASLVLTLLFHDSFDRYLLGILPSGLLVMLLALRAGRWSTTATLAGVALLAAWSIWWERDYLERRTALWQAAQALVERGIPAEEIDGGAEWNGWYRGRTLLSEAVEQGKANSKGGQLRTFVQRGLDPTNARWAVAYARRGDAPASRTLVVVPYGRGQRAIAVQRF
jgi:4-amino-4-deoxy-L-arabinose transferase-like glycosyltransferase